MFLSVFKGYWSAAALIMAIGAQNAFVLAQAVKKQHHWPVVCLCIAIDMLLISIGMMGAGAVIQLWPAALNILCLGGVVFLSWYGLQSFKAFFNPEALSAGRAQTTLKAAILTALGVSLLNPHVYLDTVVLLGSIGNQFHGAEKYGFWLGAMLASISWFVALTLLAKKLAPWLGRPQVWRWVELLVALMMWGIAFWLVWELFAVI